MIITATDKNRTLTQKFPKRYERREAIVAKNIERLIDDIQGHKMKNVKIRVEFEQNWAE